MQDYRTKVTFVCCVEYGYFAQQFVHFVESLRRWGGAFAECAVIAVTPRPGPRLPSSITSDFGKLGVTYVYRPKLRRHDWYPYLTKPSALESAERIAETEILVFMDNDVLVSAEPSELALADDVDLAAAPASAHGGSTGPGHEHEPLWNAMCQAVGVDIERLPWIDTDLDQRRIRLYFNAGIFAYRPATGFRDAYESCVHQILDAGIRCARWKTQLLEQAAFGLAVARSGARYAVLPESHNYHFGPGLDRYYTPEAVAGARLLHYHGSLQGDYRDTFLETIREDHPHIHAWLSGLGPLARRKSVRNLSETYSLGLRGWRKLQLKWFERFHSTAY